MRIRKNAKLSPLWFSHASAPESLQAHVCQLNQSPWDVLPLTHQFEGDDSLTGNASLGDSIGAVESVASMMDAVAAKAEDMVLAVNDNDVVEKKGSRALDQRARENEFGGHGFEKAVAEKRSSSCCQKTDGKGWQCRNEAKEGQSLCEHHLNLLRSYNTGNSNSSSISFRKSSAAAAAAAAAAAGARRARARAAKKGSSSSAAASNPYEFYYYSGFGPLWGRKRGDRSGGGGGGGGGGEDGNKSTHQEAGAAKVVAAAENVNNNNNNSVSGATQSSTPSSSSQFDNEEFDYVDDDDEDDGGDSGKKRMRKPVKARSLKSLM
ncbi:putative lysozyme-like protein [Quercus lobata]|uniref:WRC domain-containing protein n=1 Tax=Quercus lobata TaxID=97700 RepID=A0A7N2LHG3_QUELO|nr:putative lysozyme-like protein [Quercus lobata]